MRGYRIEVKPGDRYGRLEAIEELPPRISPGGQEKRVFSWQCDCGQVCTRTLTTVRSGNTTSCGCFMREVAAAKFRTHGKSYSPGYVIWLGMLNRCRNPDEPAFPNYGGRGIRVCERWHSFENFLADMGERPEGKTLDRIDNDGNYEPSNCRWATAQEQQRNRRNNTRIAIDGVTKTAVEWAEVSVVSARLIRHRLSMGWDAKRAVTTPADRGASGRRGKRPPRQEASA